MKIKELIEKNNVNMFYVGNHGNFDRLVLYCLLDLKKEYPDIDYAVVYAYLPHKEDYLLKNCNTVFPEELENIFPKGAITKRNMWMIDKADFVITYVCHSFGGTYEFKEISLKKGKRVIEISEFLE